MEYHETKLKLSDNQVNLLHKSDKPISIRLKKEDLLGPVSIFVTKTQLNKIEKCKSKNTGLQLNLSLKQLKLNRKVGSSIVDLINKLTGNREMHIQLPSGVNSEFVPSGSFNFTGRYSHAGPGTKFTQRINESYEGVNDLDRSALVHDSLYTETSSMTEPKRTEIRNLSYLVLAESAARIALDPRQPNYVREDAKTVAAVMSAKAKLGLGILSGGALNDSFATDFLKDKVSNPASLNKINNYARGIVDRMLDITRKKI